MITVAQLLRKINHSVDAVIGDLNARIGQPKALNSGAGQAFSFCRIEGDEGREAVRRSSASVVVVPLAADKTWCRADQTLVRSPSPRKTFLRALHEIVPAETADPGVHPTAVVDDLAEVDPTASIGALCVIHRSVKIGPRTVLHPGVVVNPDTHIGADCVLHPGVVIGADGFGYERDDDGSIIKFLHLGGVRIGERVEIGANSCVDRGNLGNTVIEDDVKIDNLVQIGHNVRIRKGAFVIGSSVISGSVDIGENSWVSPGASVLNGLKIGARALVGLGAVVIRDVPPDSVVMGNPARQKLEQ